MATKLKNLILSEVSLVDRGANPHAHVTLFKREISGKEQTNSELPVSGPAAGEIPMTEDEMKAAVAKAQSDATAAVAKAKADADAAVAKAKADAESLTDVAKADAVAKAEAEKVEMKKQLDVLVEQNEIASFAKRAVADGMPEAYGEVLRKAYKGDKDSIDKMAQMLKSAKAVEKTSAVFKEFGTANGGDATDAKTQLQVKADEVKKADPKLSAEQAYTKAYEQNSDLARQIRDEELRAASKAR